MTSTAQFTVRKRWKSRREKFELSSVKCHWNQQEESPGVISGLKSSFIAKQGGGAKCPVCPKWIASVNELFLTLGKVENGFLNCSKQFNVVKTNGLLSIIRHSSPVVWVAIFLIIWLSEKT